MKNSCPFYIIFQVLKVLLIKICMIEPPDLLFSIAFISFYISRYHFFHKFLELHSTLSEKSIFIMNFPFLFRFTETLPHPLNGQNPLSMTKAFCPCSLMLSCQEGKQKSHHIFQSFSSKEHPKIRLISMMVLKQFEKSGNLKN